MKIELIMAEFGEERKNMGGNVFDGSQRLDPTLTTFTNHMKDYDLSLTLITDTEVSVNTIISRLVLTAVIISEPEPTLKSPAVFVAVGVQRNGFSCELNLINNLSCALCPIGFAPKQIT